MLFVSALDVKQPVMRLPLASWYVLLSSTMLWVVMLLVRVPVATVSH
jgi:hypothetical protein